MQEKINNEVEKMGTNLRPELSGKNPYAIGKHRYFELKHFCMQYPHWKKQYALLDGYQNFQSFVEAHPNSNHLTDPTAKVGEERAYYSARIEMVETAARLTDPTLSVYILKGVTEGVSFDKLKACLNIPCCKDSYYSAYRKLFWLLSGLRD